MGEKTGRTHTKAFKYAKCTIKSYISKKEDEE